MGGEHFAEETDEGFPIGGGQRRQQLVLNGVGLPFEFGESLRAGPGDRDDIPPSVARVRAPAQEAPRDADIGCPYKNRCPLVMTRCQTEMPPPYPVSGGGVANCFLAADTSTDVAERQPTRERVAS